MEVTTRARLLSAVLAAPDDDTPRLIYADWLEEQGQGERAEFIRLECERAKFWHSPFCRDGCCCELGPMDARIKELAMNALDWFPTVPGGTVSWKRGFIDSLSGPLTALLEHGPAIVAENPVASVTVTDANIGKISPGFPHSRYRIWNTHPADTFGTEVGYALVGYYRSREAAAASLNAAVLRKLLSYRVGGIASSTARRPR